MNQKILIGVAWPYVNGNLHIGHLAGYLLPADIFARYNRFAGNDVLMVSGSDCFGTPITIQADKMGITPKEVVEIHHQKNLELFEKLQLTFDLYTKTDTENHKQITQDFFVAMLERGLISKRKSEQYYSEQEQRFLPDRYVEGVCPHCGTEGARSDQCENCGRVLQQGELIDPVSKISGSDVTFKETEHYFVDWDKLQTDLEKYVAQYSPAWRDWVRKETQKWLNEGLRARSITRDLDWGVELPADRIPKEMLVDNIQNKRIYVWFDAVIGYYSASMEWAKAHNVDVEKKYWLNDSSKHYYFMGKDNLVFHTLFWPGQLMSYNPEFHLPDVPAINQFLNLQGNKFSKSKGIIVDSAEITDKYGVDVVRFYLTSIMPENADSNFTWEDFEAKVNNILISNIANFIFRSLKLAEKTFSAENTAIDAVFAKTLVEDYTKAIKLIEGCNFKEYLEATIEISSKCNKFIAVKEPWKMEKGSEAHTEVINTLVYAVIVLLTLLKPIMPNMCEKLEQQLGITLTEAPNIEASEELLTEVHISKPEQLVSRIEIEVESEPV